MATYYITGIKKEKKGTHEFISEVTLHLVVDSKANQALLITKDEVIRLIKANNLVYSATWNYNSIAWSKGELVTYEKRDGVEYIRTTPDKELRDNLLHLLPLTNLGL